MAEDKTAELEEYIDFLEYENSQLQRKIDEYASGEAESRKKIEQSYREAENAKTAAVHCYAAELKALRMFSDKWRRILTGGGVPVEKKEIIDLLQGFLRDIGVDTAKQTVEKIDKLLGEDATGFAADKSGEYEFDLDEAINPSGELDLESLCRELGVFRG